jgi:hypothetical protein
MSAGFGGSLIASNRVKLQSVRKPVDTKMPIHFPAHCANLAGGIELR